MSPESRSESVGCGVKLQVAVPSCRQRCQAVVWVPSCNANNTERKPFWDHQMHRIMAYNLGDYYAVRLMKTLQGICTQHRNYIYRKRVKPAVCSSIAILVLVKLFCYTLFGKYVHKNAACQFRYEIAFGTHSGQNLFRKKKTRNIAPELQIQRIRIRFKSYSEYFGTDIKFIPDILWIADHGRHCMSTSCSCMPFHCVNVLLRQIRYGQ